MRQLLKRFTALSFSSFLLLSFLFMPDMAFAQSNDALKNFSEIASTLVHVITAAAMLLIQFFPPLWGSELITGDQVTNMLRPMWIYIRNLTNIAFVGMMLFLAFSNLVTSGKGINDWNIKSKLGPVLLGLVAINFSMLAIRVMVDVVHVGTIALLSIADPVIEAQGINNVADYYARSIDTETFEPCGPSAPGGGAGGPNCKTVRELVNNTFCSSEEACLLQIREISEIRAQAELMNNPEKKNIMLAFGSFFMKLESLPLLSADTGGILDVLDSAIFSLVFGLAYLLALAAMMIVLLVRVVMMWVFIIFSPIIMTSWVFGFKLPEIGDQFWKYLLVPVKAAAALAFGFVMISQLQLMTIPSEFFVSVIEPGASLRSLWGPDEFGGWRMLWSILTVILFWQVVFNFALKDMPGAAAIKGFGEKAGSAALSFGADQVPIGIPGGNGQSMTLASLLPGGGLNPNQFLNTYSNRARAEAGNDTSFSSVVGGGQSASGAANEFRNVRSRDAAQRSLERRDQAAFLSDFQNASAAERQEFMRVLNLALPAGTQINADTINNSTDLRNAIDRIGQPATGLFQQTPAPTTAPDPANTNPPAAAATTAVDETINVTGGDVTLELASGSVVDQAALSTVFNQTNLAGLDAARLQAIATQIAGAANITDPAAITRIRQNLANIAAGT